MGLPLLGRLLSFLHPLLLLYMSLLHLLCLLLVPLLDLLVPRSVSLPLRQLLVLLFLFLLEFLVLLLLLCVEPLLLLLVFLVQFRVSCIWGSGTCMRLNVLGVDCIGRRNIVLWTRSRGIGAWLSCATIDWRVVRRSCFSGRCDCAVVKGSRPGSSSDRRPAPIHGSPQLRVGAGSLYMLSLNGYRGDVSVTCCHLILRPRTSVYPAVTTVVQTEISRRRVLSLCVKRQAAAVGGLWGFLGLGVLALYEGNRLDMNDACSRSESPTVRNWPRIIGSRDVILSKITLRHSWNSLLNLL